VGGIFGLVIPTSLFLILSTTHTIKSLRQIRIKNIRLMDNENINPITINDELNLKVELTVELLNDFNQ